MPTHQPWRDPPCVGSGGRFLDPPGLVTLRWARWVNRCNAPNEASDRAWARRAADLRLPSVGERGVQAGGSSRR